MAAPAPAPASPCSSRPAAPTQLCAAKRPRSDVGGALSVPATATGAQATLARQLAMCLPIGETGGSSRCNAGACRHLARQPEAPARHCDEASSVAVRHGHFSAPRNRLTLRALSNGDNRPTAALVVIAACSIARSYLPPGDQRPPLLPYGSRTKVGGPPHHGGSPQRHPLGLRAHEHPLYAIGVHPLDDGGGVGLAVHVDVAVNDSHGAAPSLRGGWRCDIGRTGRLGPAGHRAMKARP